MPKGKDVGDDFDNPNDLDYVPELDRDNQDIDPSVVETTPSSRLDPDYGLNEKTKVRVKTNDPNGGRCLIENYPESRAVDFCHCVPRRFTYRSVDLMSNIEWHWNMKYYSLNLDSSHNIFRAGVSVHRLFDSDQFLLLPETKIIDQYHRVLKRTGAFWIATRKTFPDIPNRTDYQYKFFSVSPAMEEIVIHRQNRVPSPGTTRLASNDFTTHISPFNEMPLLKSHLHPKFVILEAGRKLNRISRLDARYLAIIAQHPIFDKVSNIYDAWTRAPPPEAKDDETYGRPGDGGGGDNQDDGDDADTDGGRRLRNGKKRPYPRRDGGDSPTPGAKRNQYTGLGGPGKSGKKHTTHGKSGSRRRKNSSCLSEKTLIEHERMFNNGKRWSSDAVQAWFKEVLLEQAL